MRNLYKTKNHLIQRVMGSCSVDEVEDHHFKEMFFTRSTVRSLRIRSVYSLFISRFGSLVLTILVNFSL